MAQQNINDKYYKSYFEFTGKSEWIEKIWHGAFGNEYLKDLDTYGFLTRTELLKIMDLLELSKEDIFLDIGCGKGGPGLQISQNTGAKYLGIDKVEAAVERAKVFANEFDLEQEALFHVGEFYNIPLDDEMVDHVISIDAFWAATDKLFALREIQRVLKPGGKYVFTNWDLKAQDPIMHFESSGMKFISRHTSEGWLQRQKAVYQGILKHERELRLEMGDAAEMLIYEAQSANPWLEQSIRRIYVLKKI